MIAPSPSMAIVAVVSPLLGALARSRPTDRLGPRGVTITLSQRVAVVLAAYFVATQAQFYLLGVIAGFGLGAVQAANRALHSGLIPTARSHRCSGPMTSLAGIVSYRRIPPLDGPRAWRGLSPASHRGARERLTCT